MTQMTAGTVGTAEKIRGNNPACEGSSPLFQFRFSAVICASLSSVPSWLTAVLILAASANSAEAQSTARSKAPPSTSIEGRVDAIIGHETVAQAGVGLSMWAGTYTRLGIVGAIGGGNDGLSGRVDGFGRFHLDPFRESRWGPYGGAGLSTRFDAGSRPRAYVIVFAGLDGPVKHGLTTSFEAGLGGGARIGLIIRQAVAERR